MHALHAHPHPEHFSHLFFILENLTADFQIHTYSVNSVAHSQMLVIQPVAKRGLY